MLRIVILLSVSHLFYACAGLTTAPSPEFPTTISPAAALDALALQNDALKSFKGVGKLRITSPSSTQNFRVVWAGIGLEKMRLQALDPSGRPAASFAADGHHFYLLLHRQERFVRKPASDANLQRLVSIPIRLSDVQAFLTGRIPLRSHHSAQMVRESASSQEVLILKKWWGAVVQKIHLDMDPAAVSQVEMLTAQGAPVYTVRLEAVRNVDGMRLPHRMTFSDKAGHGFELEIKRYWVNPSVSPDIFRLKDPNLDAPDQAKT